MAHRPPSQLVIGDRWGVGPQAGFTRLAVRRIGRKCHLANVAITAVPLQTFRTQRRVTTN